MAIRQARLEPLALSASDRARMIYGWAAASEDKRIDCSVGITRFGARLERKGPLVEVGPRSVFANRRAGARLPDAP